MFACVGLAPLIWVCARGEVVAEQPQPTMQGGEQLPQINPDGWTSSAVCGQCHQAIHAVWRQSLHATSWTNGVFQAGLRRCMDTYGEDKSRLCLSCHAPMVRRGNDELAKESITREGISCDFCHSVHAVELTDPKDPVRFTIGKTKYGPLQHAQSPAHQIVNSELFKRSEFCAACHEYKNARGVTILGTYGEWKNSSYAKRGTQCQDCHMPLIPGRTVALDVKRDGSGMVNLHNISGSHDLERVRKAITLSVAGYEWMGDKLWVYVKVANEGSGHCFPTGLPMHRAVLEIALQKSGEVIGRREIPFEVVMLDENGRPIQREHEVFISAASVRSDSRLKPNEVRTIDISFRDIKPSRLEMTASLYYEYSTETLVVDEKGERIEPVEMRFLVASRQHSMKQAGP
ncbi:MAG: multiheme c-type cytochrome [Phycisphaerales bacterium]|nr:multiheme c-type cytochrome [Phycisphaerales bacterium]